MGCFCSSLNRIQNQQTFTTEDILNLTQTWNILKAHDLTKFADEILIRAMSQKPNLRRFWTSKMIIDANNYDFSQGESCLNTDLSWHIGLRDHSVRFILQFDKLISSTNDEDTLIRHIKSMRHLQNISIFETDSLMILKQCIIEILHERFEMFKYNFTTGYEQSWNKFLSFIIKHLLEKDNRNLRPTQIIISPATVMDQTSHTAFNS